MQVRTRYYKPLGNIGKYNFDMHYVVQRELFEIIFDGPVEYNSDNYSREAFAIFNGEKPLDKTGRIWHSTSMSSGDIVEFVIPFQKPTVMACLHFGWKPVIWDS